MSRLSTELHPAPSISLHSIPLDRASQKSGVPPAESRQRIIQVIRMQIKPSSHDEHQQAEPAPRVSAEGASSSEAIDNLVDALLSSLAREIALICINTANLKGTYTVAK
jgi:hypothetical protein